MDAYLVKRIDITGQKFARLTALHRVEGRVWLFRCECGNEVDRPSAGVKNGNTKSCGCLSSELTAERNRTHGLCDHPLYHMWNGMKSRCRDPLHAGYKNYGGRGIRVCERWLSFENFVADVGERPAGTSIDRLRSNEDYGPTNWKWSTPTEQQENTRRNKYIELDGERLTISQWARKLGIDQRTLNQRRYRGWSDRDVLKPVGATAWAS